MPTKFEINYWQVPSQENGSLPNSSRSIQINNGSARIATLVGLNRFVDYQSEISMCTSEGCGPKSIPWDFQGLYGDGIFVLLFAIEYYSANQITLNTIY